MSNSPYQASVGEREGGRERGMGKREKREKERKRLRQMIFRRQD